MASRISQMRSVMSPQTPPMSQQQLNKSIEAARELMKQFQSVKNPEVMIMRLLQTNPNLQFLSPMLRNGANLESIAKQMAQMNDLDINQIIQGLQGGL